MSLDDIFVKPKLFIEVYLMKATTSISVYLVQYMYGYCIYFFIDVLQMQI